MRGAAAVLAGALLFFLGILAGAPARDRLSAPDAIPLGGEPATTPAPPGVAAAEAPVAGGEPAPGTTPAGGGGSVPQAVPQDAPEDVEEIGGQVDCMELDSGRGRGDSRPEGACTQTTTSTTAPDGAEGPGEDGGPASSSGPGGGGSDSGPGGGGGSDGRD